MADPKEAEAIVRVLAGDFTIDSCRMAEQLLQKLSKANHDLLLLDMDMPDMPGTAVLRILRHTDHGMDLPVVAMGLRKGPEDPVQAFDLGVDDFLAKPCDMREVAARVRAVLRRKFERLDHRGSALSIGGIDIDPSQRRCAVDGQRVKLRPGEFNLLEILMRKAGRVLTRPYILTAVSGMSPMANTRAVDVMIGRLRRKLGDRARGMIETVSKMGYCFMPPEP
ncbi:MAG: response regulator transcription factor [Elusimicrobia bacterium]|nr:response regulator transcription factor [Elusimicrobiota bacterium]